MPTTGSVEPTMTTGKLLAYVDIILKRMVLILGYKYYTVQEEILFAYFWQIWNSQPALWVEGN